jgi:hypothetical protein
MEQEKESGETERKRWEQREGREREKKCVKGRVKKEEEEKKREGKSGNIERKWEGKMRKRK